MKRILLTVIFFLLLYPVHSQSGLKFNSNDVSKDDRTSFNVFKRPILFENQISIKFDLSFYNKIFIGNILTLIDASGKNNFSCNYNYDFDAQRGGFLNINHIGQQKILSVPITEKKINTEDLVICVLDRERHQEDIEIIRSAGARIKIIGDGDVSAVISSVIDSSNIDMYYGIGGAPEGVLAAAALQCVGGYLEGQLIFYNDQETDRAKKTGITNLDKIYKLNDLAKGDVMFSATGVTDGTMLRGININKNFATTHSIVMRSKTGTIREIDGKHNFDIKQLDY